MSSVHLWPGGSGVAIEGYGASRLVSLQDFNWNVGRQSGTELYLPKMRTFVQGWAISSHQVLSLDAIELNRDVGSLEGAGILWNIYILLRVSDVTAFDLNSSLKSVLFDLIIWISHQNLKLGELVQIFYLFFFLKNQPINKISFCSVHLTLGWSWQGSLPFTVKIKTLCATTKDLVQTSK